MTDTRQVSPVAEGDENYARRRRIFVGKIAGAYGELYRELFSRPRVYRAADVPFRGGPQHWVRGVINPGRTPATQLFECHIDVYAPGAHGQRHAHMNSAVFYTLDGEERERAMLGSQGADHYRRALKAAAARPAEVARLHTVIGAEDME